MGTSYPQMGYGRSEEFHLGAISHEHMLKMGHYAEMGRMWSQSERHAKQIGSSEGHRQAIVMSDANWRTYEAARKSAVTTHKSKASGMNAKNIPGWEWNN